MSILTSESIPRFSDIHTFAKILEIDGRTLNWYNTFSFKFYKRYNIKKKSGKLREIRQPSESLKGIQAWILRNILDKVEPSKYATAFNLGSNILMHVNPHKNNRYFMSLDLEDFFPSISFYRVKGLFRSIGYCETAAEILANLCTCSKSLPQGAVTSPAISNLIAKKLDLRIAGLVLKENIVYSRYADDLTFSSNSPSKLFKIFPYILKIIQSEKFKPNMDKFRVFGPQKITPIVGLIKNNSNSSFGIGKKKKRKMRAIIYNYLIKKKVSDKYPNQAAIRGWLDFLHSVDKESSEQMERYFEKTIEKISSK